MDPEKLKNLKIHPEAKRRSSRSLWFILLVILGVTGASVFYAWPRKEDSRRVLKSNSNPASTNPRITSLESTNGAPKSREDSVLTVSGYLVNRERIELSPRFMGIVKWIGVKKGDSVTNGQVVVLLDDAEYQARLLEAQGRSAAAQVALTKAELDYQRIGKLIADGIETQQNEDHFRLSVEAARAAIKEVEGQIALIRTYLDWTTIRAPINGVVLEKLADTGELVTPQSFGGSRGPSTALLAIADPKDLQVEIDLNEADLAKISLNQPCRVTPEAFPDKTYDGYVVEIAPEANRQKGTLQIKVQIQNPNQYLTPELTARVDFLNQ